MNLNVFISLRSNSFDLRAGLGAGVFSCLVGFKSSFRKSFGCGIASCGADFLAAGFVVDWKLLSVNKDVGSGGGGGAENRAIGGSGGGGGGAAGGVHTVLGAKKSGRGGGGGGGGRADMVGGLSVLATCIFEDDMMGLNSLRVESNSLTLLGFSPISRSFKLIS